MAYLAQLASSRPLNGSTVGCSRACSTVRPPKGSSVSDGLTSTRARPRPLHLHTREDEVFLLKGEALVWVGDECHELSRGGVVYLTRNIPHGYRITSDRADLPPHRHSAGIEEMYGDSLLDFLSTLFEPSHVVFHGLLRVFDAAFVNHPPDVISVERGLPSRRLVGA
ncbi:cupin domain-containing protein [Streptomyces sp. HUCO-GS316]|uniref:cupin domain-containing protein n=1 Tax=Streptomyces sp. HUCO-GS316 TaxID=2692198 RepID=UPI001F2D2E30|nr:cupin domain-containing protein [Streptomyces sp. HUCO-GS316]